jgi:MSHA biogenesis protein MshJ
MKRYWIRIATAFDALARRERAVIFAGAVFAVAMVGYQFLIDPYLVRHAELSRGLARQQQEREVVRAGLLAAEQRLREPVERDRKMLDGLRSRTADAETRFRAVQDGLVAPQQMAVLVESLLRRNRGLHLVSLTTMPVTSVSDTRASANVAEVKAAPGKADAPDAGGLYRHGVKIRVSGSYADMLSYLAQLERLPQRMYWGSVTLDTEEYPIALMEVTLYTLSTDRSWLVI